MTTMSDHPSLDRLLDAVRGRQEAAGAVEHANDCAPCARSLAWVKRVLEAAAAGRLAETPESWIESALRIPAEVQGGRRRVPAWTPARLLRDPLAAPGGVRGVGESRRYVYEAGDAHLDLEIREAEEDAGLLRVTGQVLVPGALRPSDALATLWRDEALAAHAAAGPSGVFAFPAVPPGAYRLDVWPAGAAHAIRVQPFELREE